MTRKDFLSFLRFARNTLEESSVSLAFTSVGRLATHGHIGVRRLRHVMNRLVSNARWVSLK